MHHIDRKDDKPRMPTKVTPNVLRRVLPRPPSHSKGSTQSAWLLEHLRQALLDGQYASGSRLNEVHLSKELQVSRTPIRAALHVLAGEGLLRYHANKGFAVRVSAFRGRRGLRDAGARRRPRRPPSRGTRSN